MGTYINGESRIYSDYIGHYDCRGIYGSYRDPDNILHHSMIEYEIYVNDIKATHNDYYSYTLNANQENVIEYRFVKMQRNGLNPLRDFFLLFNWSNC